jgi:hypothetical protein
MNSRGDFPSMSPGHTVSIGWGSNPLTTCFVQVIREMIRTISCSGTQCLQEKLAHEIFPKFGVVS